MHYQDQEILSKINFFILNEAEEDLLKYLSKDIFNNEEEHTAEEIFNYIDNNYSESDIILFSGLYLDFNLTYDSEEELYLVE